MDAGADAAGYSDDRLILDVARALVRDAIEETRTEVKAIVKERLLSEAMRELAEAAEATASAAPKRGDVSRAVEATVRTIAAYRREGSPARLFLS